MRLAFLLAILALALAYTYMAFANLSFLSSTGRLGPGFFPRIIGVALIATCLYAIASDYRSGEREEGLSDFWRVTLVVAGLSTLFVAVLNVLGGLLAMIAFMLAALTILNRGRPAQNLAVSLALPIAVFLLFDRWLNAAMPQGVVPLPL
jgi:putative tricarboxylic transport membrane protein